MCERVECDVMDQWFWCRSLVLTLTLTLTRQDVNTTRYHIVTAERLLKTDLQPGGYKQTMLGFSFQLGIFPQDGKVPPNPSMSAHPSLRLPQ